MLVAGQTVWREAVPEGNLHSIRIVPDLDGSRFVLTPSLSHDARAHTIRAILLDGDNEIGGAEAPALNGGAFFCPSNCASNYTTMTFNNFTIGQIIRGKKPF